MKRILTLTKFEVKGHFECEGEVVSEEQSRLEDFCDDLEDGPDLDMDGKLGQISGRTDAEGLLSDHIKDWFIGNGPSPFLKKVSTAANK